LAKEIDLVITSIDGSENIQDKICGKGVFQKKLKALEILAKNKIKTVVVSVISNENINNLDEILRIVSIWTLLGCAAANNSS